MRDRGAQCAVLECAAPALAQGTADWVELTVVVHTCFRFGSSSGPSSGAGPAGAAARRAAGAAAGAQGSGAAGQGEVTPEKALEAALEAFDRVMDPNTQVGVFPGVMGRELRGLRWRQ